MTDMSSSTSPSVFSVTSKIPKTLLQQWSPEQQRALPIITSLLDAIRSAGVPGTISPRKPIQSAAELSRAVFGAREDSVVAQRNAANLATASILEKHLCALRLKGALDVIPSLFVERFKPFAYYRKTDEAVTQIPGFTWISLRLTCRKPYTESTVVCHIDNSGARGILQEGPFLQTPGGKPPSGHIEQEAFSDGSFFALDQASGGTFAWVFRIDWSQDPAQWPKAEQRAAANADDRGTLVASTDPDVNVGRPNVGAEGAPAGEKQPVSQGTIGILNDLKKHLAGVPEENVVISREDYRQFVTELSAHELDPQKNPPPSIEKYFPKTNTPTIDPDSGVQKQTVEGAADTVIMGQQDPDNPVYKNELGWMFEGTTGHDLETGNPLPSE